MSGKNNSHNETNERDSGEVIWPHWLLHIYWVPYVQLHGFTCPELALSKAYELLTTPNSLWHSRRSTGFLSAKSLIILSHFIYRLARLCSRFWTTVGRVHDFSQLSYKTLHSPEQLVIISDKYMRQAVRAFGNTSVNSLRTKYWNASGFINFVSFVDEMTSQRYNF